MSKKTRQESFKKLEKLINSRENLTFYRLASELGFANSLFSDWKSGKSMPKADKLIKIAEYFNVEIGYFY